MGFLSEMRTTSAARLERARAQVPETELERRIHGEPVPLVLGGSFDVIAELKLRSPALGDLSQKTTSPLDRVRAYIAGGARACSILTEPSRFDGALAHLAAAAEVARPLGVPVMRKDFLVDPYQVLEARAYGASGVLLVARMLDDRMLAAMLDCARSLGLFVLLEAFDEDDLKRSTAALDARAGRGEPVLLGLNARDLETLTIDAGRFARLAPALPRFIPCVAESGIETPYVAAQVARLGYRAALVGTGLMRSADPEAAVAALLAAGRAG